MDKPVVLSFCLLAFAVIFFAFLFFNPDPVAKVLICAFSGIFMVLTAIRLIQAANSAGTKK